MTLYESLNMYAMEDVFGRFQQPYKPQLKDLYLQIEQTMQLLQKFGPQAGELAQTLDSCQQEYLELMEEIFLLTGMSIGMELQKLVGLSGSRLPPRP